MSSDVRHVGTAEGVGTLRLVYVAGYGRSGSTLVDTILGNAEGALGLGELSTIFSEVILGHPCSCGADYLECELWGPVLDDLLLTVGSWEKASALVRNVEGADRIPLRMSRYQQLWSTLLEGVAQRGSVHTIVDSSKTSRTGYRRPLALDPIPTIDLKVVHLVRDPRAVLWSVRRGNNVKLEHEGAARPGSMLRGVLGWISANQLAERVIDRVGAERSHLLRYEDLMAHPEYELERLGSHLELDLSAVTAALLNGGHMGVGHGVAGNRVRRAGPIELTADNEWRTALPPAGLQIARLARPWASRYGYALDD